ncbi:hypothetical protein [Metabacillus sp. FJAT-53654]|uniref:Uncharacterized protein n=1 Tax=Metabacillus rhizosphaerae TaxID=3117747 RepID=A0ABZ2MYI0_9BACI
MTSKKGFARVVDIQERENGVYLVNVEGYDSAFDRDFNEIVQYDGGFLQRDTILRKRYPMSAECKIHIKVAIMEEINLRN